MQLPPQKDTRPLNDPNRVLHEQALAKARLDMLNPPKPPVPTTAAPAIIAALLIMVIIAAIVLYYPNLIVSRKH